MSLHKLELGTEKARELLLTFKKVQAGTMPTNGNDFSRLIHDLSEQVKKLEAVELEDDNRFWELVELVGWNGPKKDTDTDAKKAFLMKNMTRWESAKMSTRISYHIAEVSKAISNTFKESEEYVGDDSYTDLCAEIVGRGKAFYQSVLANPKIALQMLKDNSYCESFSHCWPYETDYDFREGPEFYRRASDFILSPNHYNPTNWDKVTAEERAICQPVYDKMVSMVLNGKYDFSPAGVAKYIIGLPNFKEIYAISYKQQNYGFGNFMSDVKKLMSWCIK